MKRVLRPTACTKCGSDGQDKGLGLTELVILAGPGARGEASWSRVPSATRVAICHPCLTGPAGELMRAAINDKSTMIAPVKDRCIVFCQSRKGHGLAHRFREYVNPVGQYRRCPGCYRMSWIWRTNMGRTAL